MSDQQEVQCMRCGRRAWLPVALDIPPCSECDGPRLRTGRYQLPRLASSADREQAGRGKNGNPRYRRGSGSDGWMPEVYKLHI